MVNWIPGIIIFPIPHFLTIWITKYYGGQVVLYIVLLLSFNINYFIDLSGNNGRDQQNLKKELLELKLK